MALTEKELDAIFFDGILEAAASHSFFYFDLEAIPNWSAAARIGIKELEPVNPTPIDQLPEPNVDCGVEEFKKRCKDIVLPPAEYIDKLRSLESEGKNRKGIFDAIKELTTDDSASAVEAQRKMLATNPETASIVAMAYAIGDEEIRVSLAPRNGQVAELLHAFWDLAAKCDTLVGYNIIEYDLPLIHAESIRAGIEPSRHFSSKPWGNDVVDLYSRRYPKSKPPQGTGFGKLKTIARLMDIDVPADEADGGDVYRWYLDSDWKSIEFYAASDVDVTRKLHHIWRGRYCP